jgi:hypothetical protein
MILGARIANRTPGAEIDGELSANRRYSGSRVRISPEKRATGVCQTGCDIPFLLTGVKRLLVSHDCFGIGAYHVKLRHRGAERLAASRD